MAASIGQFIAIGFGLLGLSAGNPILLLIALFVWIGAESEAVQVEERVVLRGLPVRTAMVTEFHTLTSDQTLGDAADLLLAGTQQDFPVVGTDEETFQGVLTRSDLLAGLARAGREALVRDHVKVHVGRVEADSPLVTAMTQLREGQGPCLQVVEHDRTIGLLTLENIGEFLMIRSALQENHQGDGNWPSPASATARPPAAATALAEGVGPDRSPYL
jgi:CBS domain-containing protein